MLPLSDEPFGTRDEEIRSTKQGAATHGYALVISGV